MYSFYGCLDGSKYLSGKLKISFPNLIGFKESGMLCELSNMQALSLSSK